MDRLILDTNILMHLVRGDKIAGEVKAYIDRKEDPNLFVSVVSIAEAESLVIQWGWGKPKVDALRKLIRDIVSIDISISQNELIDAYVAIDAFSQGKTTDPKGKLLSVSSRNMGKNDLWIAATVFVLDGELLTADKDFDHLAERWFPIQKFR